MEKRFIKTAVQTLVLTLLVLLSVIPFSCRITEEGIRVTGGDYVAPSIEKLEVLNERTVKMDFSEPVKITSAIASKVIRDYSDSAEHSETESPSPAIAAAGGAYGRIPVEANVSDNGLCVTFLFENECEVGQAYEIYGVVEDKTGNSLTFCVPFTGFNSRIPDLIITELQVKYSKGKGEFVELLALTDGNLGGLEIFSGIDGETKSFELPPVEVTKGELILVHMRKVEEDCVNETGENLDEATAPYSAAGVRDLWSDNAAARFNDNADVVALRIGTSGALIDAMMYASETVTVWKVGAAALARTAREEGIFEETDISSAADAKGASYAKSFQRIDAASIRARLLNGEQLSLPLKFSAENWTVGTANPGML